MTLALLPDSVVTVTVWQREPGDGQLVAPFVIEIRNGANFPRILRGVPVPG